MKSMPARGWVVFARNSRTEWPIMHTFRGLRREARQAWFDEMTRMGMAWETAREIWLKRTADGSIRIRKCMVHAPLSALSQEGGA